MTKEITRRSFHRLLLGSAATCSVPHTLLAVARTQSFIHPGMLQIEADLWRMKKCMATKAEPILGGFRKLSEDPGSRLDYVRAGASEEIGRNPNVRFAEFDRDANAAYQSALMWTITGNHGYSKIAIEIVNDWSHTLKNITGADAILCAALGGFKLANAGELLRYTGSGWNSGDAKRFGALLLEVFLPVIANFAPFANGNWDTAAVKLMMAIGIYLDDRSLFDRAINYYRHGCGDGQLAHYIYSNGQCQESGRDQQHTQLGLAHMGDACEMAWHQGLDLYGELDNRLLKGFEYTAKYCLGETVPFAPDIDQTGKYPHPSISARSALRPGYEQIYNHYVHRRGIEAPWTTQAAQKLRPEGPPFQADATGFGTLLYSRPNGPDIEPARSRTVMYARNLSGEPAIDFVPVVGAATYDILRAEKLDGPYQRIAQNIASPRYLDHAVKSGQLYFYKVGQGTPVAQMAGLPAGWRHRGGEVSFDGRVWRLLAGDEMLTVDREGAAGLVARMQPPVASSFARVGLCVDGQPTLTISHGGGSIERPGWSASAGGTVVALSAPMVALGRLTGQVWLRVSEGDAAVSSDGMIWQKVGSVKLGNRLGLFLCSGIANVDTEISFDRLSILDV